VEAVESERPVRLPVPGHFLCGSAMTTHTHTYTYTLAVCSTTDVQVNKHPQYSPLLISVAIVLQNWKSKKSCHINDWTNLISEHISMEKHNAYRRHLDPIFDIS